MNYFFFIFSLIFIFKSIKPEKIVEIDFFRKFSNKSTTYYSELIKFKLYVTFRIGSNEKNIDLEIAFHTPYFSISSEDVENSSTYKALEQDYNFYSKTEFNYAQKAEEKIELNEKISIEDFKIISDAFGEGKLGLNLNFDNSQLLDFNFIKELIRKNLVETYDMRMIYNAGDLTKGKIIFGLGSKYTIPMHIEENSIFCFRVDKVTYQGEDYTTELGLDYNSGGILAPRNAFKKIEKFFEPFVHNNICNYTSLSNYISLFFCNENFNDIENFGKIYININDDEFKHSFILEGKDLFVKVDNGYLFLIRTFIFSSADKWVLGLPFINKYPITLNLNEKTVGFDINKNIEDDKPKDNINILPWILFGALFFIFIIFVAIILYLFVYKRKRKIRANELDEDIIYNEKSDKENNLGI